MDARADSAIATWTSGPISFNNFTIRRDVVPRTMGIIDHDNLFAFTTPDTRRASSEPLAHVILCRLNKGLLVWVFNRLLHLAGRIFRKSYIVIMKEFGTPITISLHV